MSSEDARKRWELENDIEGDSVFEYPDKLAKSEEAPWEKDPKCFKNVRMSAVALLKIISHADSVKIDTIWGMVKGYHTGDTIIILDALELPHTSEQQEEALKRVLAEERIIGWYKSHPGYGLYLGGIERQTANLFSEPRVAIIVDPTSTSTAGKVSMAAFRTCPDKPPAAGYYSLNLSFFKSSLDSKLIDLFWNKYWGARLAESDLMKNNRFAAGKIGDIAALTEEAEQKVEQTANLERNITESGANNNQNRNSWEATEKSTETSIEQINGILAESVKLLMFSSHNSAEK